MIYKSTVLTTTLELDPSTDNKSVRLKLPFKVFGQNIVRNGKDVTYRMNDLSLKGKEVIAKVDYQVTNEFPHQDDSLKVSNFSGNIGTEFKNVVKDTRYTKHYNVKKSERRATFDKDGVKTLYNGADKNDVTQFAQWEGAVVVKEVVL